MKTLNKHQNWSMSLKPAPTFTEESSRPKIGDDDGISNRAMNALIVVFTLITLGISIFTASAQDNVKYRIMLRQAMLDMDRIEYDKALIKLLEVRANTAENANVSHMIGLCYLYGQESADKAAFYLNQAVKSVSKDYQEWDLDETNAPLQTAYHLAIAYEKLEDFGRAAGFYQQYLALVSNPDKPNTSRTYAIISSNADRCQLAAEKQVASFGNENVVINK
jgi:tetratricopeptide (TPR) repeat protein